MYCDTKLPNLNYKALDWFSVCQKTSPNFTDKHIIAQRFIPIVYNSHVQQFA